MEYISDYEKFNILTTEYEEKQNQNELMQLKRSQARHKARLIDPMLNEFIYEQEMIENFRV